MSNENLFTLIENRAQKRELNAPFLEVPAGLTYTWRDLLYGSARIAGWLAQLEAASDGHPPRLAAQVEKSPEAVLLYLAALRAGFAFVPLNLAYRRGEVEYFLNNARPTVFVCPPERVDELALTARTAGCRHVVTLGEARDGSLLSYAAPFPDQFPTRPRRADELAAILYTSGTTGVSKGAMLTHGNLAANALTLNKFWGFNGERRGEHGDTQRDVLLHALPLFHVHGLFVALHCALLACARMIFLSKFDPAQVLAQLPRATVFMGVPTYYTRLLALPGLDRRACRNMRLFVAGSAPLAVETFEEFRRRTGHTLVERYGMSETLMLVSNPYFGDPQDRIAGTVGLPLPDVSVRVVGDDGKPCGAGVIGQVQVKGPNVCAGYWRMPEKTAEEFTADRWFKTGDVGYFGGAGKPAHYLTLAGRSKDLIISGGYNVYPKEIEIHLDAIAGVIESAVIGLPHPDFGEAVAAVVVAGPALSLDEAQIIARLKTQIANYKVPKRIWLVDELPRNAMSKVLKNVLRDRYRNVFAA